MKRHKNHLKALFTALALMLSLAGPVFPGAGEGAASNIPTPPKFPPVEEEIPETDEGDGISPLTDMDDLPTMIEA